MAKLVNDQIVIEPRKVTDSDNASFADLRKVAMKQSPISTVDPEKYAKGK